MTMYDAKTGAVVNNPLGAMVRKGGASIPTFMSSCPPGADAPESAGTPAHPVTLQRAQLRG